MSKWCLLALILWLQGLIGFYANAIVEGKKCDRIALVIVGALGGIAVAIWKDKP